MATPRYDLHVHSTASDGVLAPREVVALAAQRGLAGIALTDHDTVSGINEAQAMARSLDIRCLAGVELSCSTPDGKQVHLLGYMFDPEDTAMAAIFDQMHIERIERTTAIVERVQQFHPELTPDLVRAESIGSSPGRPHIARAMVKLGIIRDTDAAFTPDWFAPGGRAWVEHAGQSLRNAIAALHHAGGIAVFAHPAARTATGLREAEIREAVTLGLDGVEVDHPSHDGEAVERCAHLAVELGLIQTAGSDDHGTDLDGPRLGCRTVVQRTVDQMQARAAEHRNGAA